MQAWGFKHLALVFLLLPKTVKCVLYQIIPTSQTSTLLYSLLWFCCASTKKSAKDLWVSRFSKPWLVENFNIKLHSCLFRLGGMKVWSRKKFRGRCFWFAFLVQQGIYLDGKGVHVGRNKSLSSTVSWFSGILCLVWFLFVDSLLF